MLVCALCAEGGLGKCGRRIRRYLSLPLWRLGWEGEGRRGGGAGGGCVGIVSELEEVPRLGLAGST